MTSCSWKKAVSSMRFWGKNKALTVAGYMLATSLVGIPSMSWAASHGTVETVAGMWLVQHRDGIFKVAPCNVGDSQLCGWLVGMDYTEREPEKDVTGRSECNSEIITGMNARADGYWHGKIRNPRTGHVYQAIMWLSDKDTLKLKGYIGVPLFGKTQTWTRTLQPAIGEQCRMQGHS